MKNRIPVRLRKEPLLEAIWEIRFSGAKPLVADLLPGMLFKSFPGKYDTAFRLPGADIPAPVVEHDPNLRYAPKIRLEGANQAVLIGDRVVSLSCRRPYSGWAKFSDDIRELAEAVQETGLVDRLERFSLKYIDLIELEKPVGLALLDLGWCSLCRLKRKEVPVSRRKSLYPSRSRYSRQGRTWARNFTLCGLKPFLRA